MIQFSPSDATGTQEWTFGDDGVHSVKGNPGEDIYHYYALDGTYTVTLKTTSGLGGVYQFTESVVSGVIPTKGYITRILLKKYIDSIPDADLTRSDIYFKINKYAESSNSNLYTSAITTNCDSTHLPLIIDLSGANKIEFPLQNSLVSVSVWDDNSGSGSADDQLSYLAWYDYSYKPPAKGYTFIGTVNQPNYYPDTIANSDMVVTLQWQ